MTKKNRFWSILLLTMLLSVTGTKAIAHDIEVVNDDGVTIYYVWTNNHTELAVTYRGHDYYSYFDEYIGNVVIPESVTYEGTVYPVTSIGYQAFYECYGLTSVTIGNSVTSIDIYAFGGCSALTSVTIGNSVTSIGGGAFSGCNSLTSIIVESGNSTYDSRNNCNAIIETKSNTLIAGCPTTIIPNSVNNIGSSAFYENYSLTSITIPNSVTTIGEHAFEGCISLMSIDIPNSVTSIGDGAFRNCHGLTNVTIGNSVTIIGEYAFDGCIALTSVIIPNSVTTIGYKAFSGCSGLTSVTIGNSVTSIEWNAFEGCYDLTSITIPTSVTSIGGEAFRGCYHLSTISCLNPIPPTMKQNVFYCDGGVRDKYEVYTYASLHVPMGSGELYSSAYEWRYFNKIKEDMESNGRVYYANLTVQQGTTGYTRQPVKASEKYTIYIGSLGDNTINAVMFNGIDVTDEVVNGYYTTPEIKGESVLSVTYESSSAAVRALSADDVRVTGYHGEINISRIDEPMDVYVYAADGKLIGSIPAAMGSVSMKVPTNQLYVVKVGLRTYKLAL